MTEIMAHMPCMMKSAVTPRVVLQPSAKSKQDMNQSPSFAELFTPKLVTVLREGYRLKEFKAMRSPD